MAVKSEAEQRLVSQANLGEPQAVLGLLDQNPGLEKSLGLLAETPLRWALAQRPANARRMLSEAVTQIPPMLRATEAPPDSVWLECLESQPEESGSVRPADKMFPNHPEVLDGIKYLRGFRSHDRDSSYNVFINGKAKRLSALVGLVDSNRTNGHLRFLIMVDGRCAGDSGFMVGGQKPKLLVVDLTGVQKLSVRVDTGGNGTWANPAIAGALLELTPDEYMHSAAVSGKVEELSQLLNGNRKRVRAVDGLFGLPPFGVACMAGQTDAALVIARQGGEVNATNAEGDTILHIAAAKGWVGAVYAACAAGSDPRLRNTAGLTAHEIAVAKNHLKVVARLSEAELWLAPQAPVRPAPDFSVTDLDGGQVALSSFRGRIVALFFLCTMSYNKDFNYPWLDYAQRLHDSPGGKQGRLVVLVATPDDPKFIKGFLQDHGYTFRVLSDRKDTIRKTLGLYAMPVVLIDSGGGIRWQRRMWQRSEVEDNGLFLAAEKVLAGNFNYRSISPAATTTDKPDSEHVLYDFEGGLQDWQTTGNCWEKTPATDALYPGLVKGYVGRSFLSTFGSKGFHATGLANSPNFAISKPFLHVLVGGGDFPDHCAVALVSDGCAVRRASGRNTAELQPLCWDVRDLMGKKVHLEVYDSGTVEPRDFIMLDHVVASDSTALPTSYAKRFDPDDPKSSAEVADAVPPAYKALQSAEFHELAVPGTTYHMERTNSVRWPDGAADWLEAVCEPPPAHFAQTLRSFAMTVEAGGKSYHGRPVSTGRAFFGQAYVCYVPASTLPDRRGIVKCTCEMTANRLQILSGEAPEKPQLPAYLRSTLISSYHYQYTNQLVAEFIKTNKLWRWSGETDAAYLLRAYRFFQRNFTYFNYVPWGGWPSSHPEIWKFERLADDCAMVEPMACLLRANGIPAHYEQGGWVGDNGSPVGSHVKGLVFIQKVGWLWFGVDPGVYGQSDPFSPGSRSGDNFLGNSTFDIPAQYPIPDPIRGTKVLRGQVDGGDGWHTWVVSRVPDPPAGYLLDPRKAHVTDSRGKTFTWQPECKDDVDGDHYVFGGWTPAGDRGDYLAYGMASVRGVMRTGVLAVAHPAGDIRQIEWPITAKAGQTLRFSCCLTDRAVCETRRGAKVQVELSGGGQSSEVLAEELKPRDQKVIEVTKTLTGMENSLVLKFDNLGSDFWPVLYFDASLK